MVFIWHHYILITRIIAQSGPFQDWTLSDWVEKEPVLLCSDRWHWLIVRVWMILGQFFRIWAHGIFLVENVCLNLTPH